MRPDQIRRIGVMGGGVMGGGIGQVMAVAGYDVVIRDLDDEILAATRETVLNSRWGLKRAVEIGKLGFDVATGTVERIAFTTRVEDLADSDFLIEAIPERIELKQEEFQKLDKVIRQEAVFAYNTSGFVIADIARDVIAPRRALFAGMHFASPVPAMRMCEVIYTPETSQDTVDCVRSVAEKSGKVVSMVKDAPGTYGFLLNRIFGAARREAEKIVKDGIATREDIDKAMMTGRNWPVGFYNSRGTRTGWK